MNEDLKQMTIDENLEERIELEILLKTKSMWEKGI